MHLLKIALTLIKNVNIYLFLRPFYFIKLILARAFVIYDLLPYVGKKYRRFLIKKAKIRRNALLFSILNPVQGVVSTVADQLRCGFESEDVSRGCTIFFIVL